jgi:Uma2 family endonuclease
MTALLEPPTQVGDKAVKKNTKRAAPATPRAHRFTRDELYEMSRAGMFQGKKVHLLHGRLIVMPPPGPEHDYVLDQVMKFLRRTVPDGHYLREQRGLAVGPHNDPVPDAAVVLGDSADYLKRHPITAIFAAEVSNTTLYGDTKIKPFLYALAGVPEYWVVDLNGRRIVVHTQPRTDDGVHSYGSVVTFVEGQTVAPHFAPAAAIAVAALLPPLTDPENLSAAG